MADEKTTKEETGLQMQKRSGVEKFASSFIKEDAHNIKGYVFKEVLIPALKKLIDDMLSNTIHMALYGSPDGRSDRYRRDDGYTAYGVSYRYRDRDRDRRRRSYYDDDYDDDYDLDEDPSLSTFGQAKLFAEELSAVLDRYDILTIAEYKDILKDLFKDDVLLTWKPSDTKYGWTGNVQPKVERTRNGRFIVRMPKAAPIER